MRLFRVRDYRKIYFPGQLCAERLEDRRLLATAPIPLLDGDDRAGGCPVCGAAGCSEHMGVDGNVFVKCVYQPAVAPQSLNARRMAPVAPLTDTFKLHSLPSATKKIYLDFDGHVTSGTLWQGGASFDTPAFSLDANYAQFSDAERQAIQEVWARVAEDFYPFDVDVTTEEPPVDDLRKSGDGDTRWGMRVVLGGSGGWMSGAAGVAYLNSFSWNSDTPCFVFADQSWKSNLNFMATAVSHEVGHTLGLRHDGFNGREYYSGRGTGETGWGPIMGNPGFVNLTQWSRGEYGGSTNREDDLSIITGGNGFGFRPDDHGGTAASATQAPAGDFELSGFIGESSDVDMFRFTTAGRIDATISPISVGTNLDILATLIDSSGTTVATSNPLDKVGASFTLTVSAGTYFLAVRGTGMGDINTTGYTPYGSLGQYTVKVGSPAGPTPSLAVSDVLVLEGEAGTTLAQVAVRLSAAATAAVTVQVATANGTATTADGDYVAGSATLVFAPGEMEKTFSVPVRGDKKIEPDETFFVRLSNASGAIVGDAEGIVTIGNDDREPGISIDDITIVEGNSGTRNANFVVRLSGPLTKPVFVRYASQDGTATAADADYIPISGTLTFLPGETVKTLIVLVRSDAKAEANETLSLVLSNASNAPIYKATAVATIENDDSVPSSGTSGGASAPPLVSIGDARMNEGQSGSRMLTFVVSLSRPATEPVSVRFRTMSGTASTGSDFTAATGELRFTRGTVSLQVQIAIVGDRLVEPDESFSLQLFEPRGLSLSRATAVGTIINDDAVVARLAAAAALTPPGRPPLAKRAF